MSESMNDHEFVELMEKKLQENESNRIFLNQICNFFRSENEQKKSIEKENKMLKEKYENLNKNFFEADTIKINVGGVVFETLKSTLTKRIKKMESFGYYPNSLLYDLVNANCNINLDKDDSIFIDRSSKYFNYVLSYLRSVDSGFLVNFNCSDDDKLELIKEADYYRLQGLKDLLISNLKNSLSFSFLDSLILTFDQMNFLIKLCDFPGNTKFKLIYRATRDGFMASSFHNKCDRKLKTLTVIKSSNSFIFGGYIEGDWSCHRENENKRYGTDPKAFIFSLVNKDNNPLIMKCFNPANAYYKSSRRLSSFGMSDLLIFDRSNMNIKSISNLGWNYKHPRYQRGSLEAQSFLAGSNQFSTKEIEVYCLE